MEELSRHSFDESEYGLRSSGKKIDLASRNFQLDSKHVTSM